MKDQGSTASCVADAAAFAGHLQFCRRAVCVSLFKPTWELLPRDHAMDLLALTPASPAGPLPIMYLNLLDLPDEEAAIVTTQRFKIRRVTCSTLTWEQSLARYMVAAIRKWVGVILTNPPAFDLGRKLNKLDPLSATLHSGLVDVFAGKAAGTLHGRVGPMLRYVVWCSKEGVSPFPVQERVAYAFVKAREESTAPTFLRSFLVSLSFCHHLLGLLGAQEAALSARVVGASRHAYLRKRKKVQKPPLTVAMVADLERFVAEPEGSLEDRVAAGFFLLCVYTRGRYSDCLNLQGLAIDTPDASARPLVGYIEGSVSRCKTAYTVERKTQLLPLVAPRHGVTGLDWSTAWLRVDWLRSILLGKKHDNCLVAKVGTHSCKATALSWLSKAGIDLPTRRLLGYHAQADEKTALVYSRDAMSGPIRSFEKVIRQIHSKTFLPDSTRSGYFPADEPSDSEDSADEEDNQEDQDMVDAAQDEVVGDWKHFQVPAETKKIGAAVYRNKLTRTIHEVAGADGTKFRCGRGISSNYCKLKALPKFAYPMCKSCFNS